MRKGRITMSAKTRIPNTVVECPTVEDLHELIRLREEDGEAGFCSSGEVRIAETLGTTLCIRITDKYLMCADHKYYKRKGYKIITMEEFRGGKAMKKKVQVTEIHKFQVSGVEYDVVDDKISGETVDSIIKQRDKMTTQLKMYRKFKKRVS